MKKTTHQNLWAGVASSIVFILLFIILSWPLLVSLLLAIAIFVGVYLLNQPVVKIGDIELERLKNGAEIQEIFLKATQDMTQLETLANMIQHPELAKQAQELSHIGRDILNYLEAHPEAISSSRHFLDYYVGTALKILDNYILLKKSNVSEGKYQLITEKTEDSLNLLTTVFARQRDGYHQHRIVDLEVQAELLEKTIKLGGD